MTAQQPKIYLYKRIVQAKLFIDVHFSDSIDLNDIADEACFSKFHFIRLFKSIYGKTPHQYLKKIRIENAKLYLQQGMSVAQACFSVGFDSVTSFTTLFKQSVKTSPSSYQKQHQQREALIKEAPLQFVPNCFAQQKGWTQKSNFEEAQ